MHTGTKYMASTHVHSLYKQNSPLSRFNFFSAALVKKCKTFNINAEKPNFYSRTVGYFKLVDLLETNKVQEAKLRVCHWCTKTTTLVIRVHP